MFWKKWIHASGFRLRGFKGEACYENLGILIIDAKFFFWIVYVVLWSCKILIAS